MTRSVRFLNITFLVGITACSAGTAEVLSSASGDLVITVDLPVAGVAPEITITGPQGFQRTVAGNAAIGQLAFGHYEIRAAAATGGGNVWEPSASGQVIEISASATHGAVTVHYLPMTGALNVTIAGLPGPSPTGVRIDGPGGYGQVMAASGTLTGLTPGSYTITASIQTIGTALFEPAAQTTTVEVVAGSTPATAMVVFSRESGTIAVTMTGLPAGVPANVMLQGPNGYQTSVTGNDVLNWLDPGGYVATLLPVTYLGNTWTPVVASAPIAVNMGVTPLEVTYTSATGLLAVDVEGLPAGFVADLTVTGPGFSRTVAAGATIGGLAPGTYTIAAGSVGAGSQGRVPTPARQSVDVSAGTVARGAVSYASTRPASLAVQITGVPAGRPAEVVVRGPDGFTRQLTASATLADLVPGTYSVAAVSLSHGGSIFLPAPPTQSIDVNSGESATSSVAYAVNSPTEGTLTVTLTGTPSGTDPSVIVTGPSGFVRALSATATLAGLAPGAYTVTASTVGSVQSSYAPSPATQNIEVLAGAASAAEVDYAQVAPTTGTLTINVSGLPSLAASSVTANIVVSGPVGFARQLTTTTTMTGLAPGNYTVSASSVGESGTVYAPSPSSQVVPVVAGNATTGVVAYALVPPTTGTLSVNVFGLPSGASANLTITGPGGYSRQVSATTMLTDLAPGQYTVAAAGVVSGGSSYTPGPATQSAAVTAGAAATASVTYALLPPSTGGLTVTLSGLPAGANGDITVTGSGGFVRLVTATTTLTGLTTGSYVVTSASVVTGGSTYSAAPASQTTTVNGGATASAAVSYSLVPPTTGTLTVNVAGLPGGTNADITVSGVGGFSSHVTATASLTGLPAGSYTITAVAVGSGATAFAPTPPSQTLNVTGGSTATGAVSYAAVAAQTGALTVTVSGLAAGTSAAVSVTGPGGFVQQVTTTTTLSDLAPGDYSVTAASVTSGSSSYTPTPPTQAVTVTAGTTGGAAVNYTLAAPTTGAITITISGLPAGTNAGVILSGPGAYWALIYSNTTATNLAPGTYTIAASAVGSGSSSYTPTPTSQSITVTAGVTATGAVTYALAAPTTGTLVVNVSGLPAGTNSGITVTGPGGFTQQVTATATLSTLAPGSYLVSATAVTAGGSSYTPTPPTQTLSVAAGATTTGSVSYALVPPLTGTLTVTISGLPILTLANVTVTGPGGYSRQLTATTTMSGLTAGSYTIAASAILGLYVPLLGTQTVSVVGGATVGATVTYTGTSAAATVTVDTMNRLQVMAGWEGNTQIGAGSPGFSSWQMPLLDLAANSLGLNRVRLEIKSSAESANDNNDPNVINPSGFNFSALDQSIQLTVVPLRQRLAGRGEALYVNLNFVAFRNEGPLQTDPAEYAEFMLATFQHMQNVWGFVPDGIEMILEPDNGTLWTNGTMIGEALKAAGDRLAAAGYHPEFIGPSTMSMAVTVSYLDGMLQVPGVLTYLKEVSYHRYAGVSDANLAAIRSRAIQYGLRTAMLEYIGSDVEDLYKDLTIAGVSSWQQYTIAYPTVDNGGHYYSIVNGVPVMGSRTPALRQYFRYVRMGAQRVGASSSTGVTRPVAFTNPGGGMAVILHLDGVGDIVVNGLRPGVYGVEMTTYAGAIIQLPDVDTQGAGSARISPSQLGVLTLYRR